MGLGSTTAALKSTASKVEGTRALARREIGYADPSLLVEVVAVVALVLVELVVADHEPAAEAMLPLPHGCASKNTPSQ